jgi:hypothetical protein
MKASGYIVIVNGKMLTPMCARHLNAMLAEGSIVKWFVRKDREIHLKRADGVLVSIPFEYEGQFVKKVHAPTPDGSLVRMPVDLVESI